MRTPSHAKLRLVLAARIQAWRTAAGHAFNRSAEEPDTAMETDARAATLREVADDVEAVLSDDVHGEA